MNFAGKESGYDFFTCPARIIYNNEKMRFGAGVFVDFFDSAEAMRRLFDGCIRSAYRHNYFCFGEISFNKLFPRMIR